MIASHVLLLMKVPPNDVNHWIDESRMKRDDLLRMVYPGQEAPTLDQANYLKEGLHVILLTKGAYAINQSLKDLPFKHKEIKITAIRRGNLRIIDPALTTILEEGDIVVLYGIFSHLVHAESILLNGKT